MRGNVRGDGDLEILGRVEGSVVVSGDVTVGDDVLLILPVRNLVLFPGVVMPLTVGRKGSVEAAQEAVRCRVTGVTM